MVWLFLHTLLANCQSQERLPIFDWKVSPIPAEFQGRRELWDCVNLCRRASREQRHFTDSTAYEKRVQNHLRMCLFPSVAAVAATGLCSCGAARLRAGRRAGGRGGASPNQQQYNSPTFHSFVKSNEFNAHSQISLFSTQALIFLKEKVAEENAATAESGCSYLEGSEVSHVYHTYFCVCLCCLQTCYPSVFLFTYPCK